MMAAQNTVQDIDDPRSRAFLDGESSVATLTSAWCNFCRVMGQDFAPFLPHVLPPLLKAASYTPAAKASPSGLAGLAEDETEDEDEYETRSAEEDEKIIALDNLTRYGKALKGTFAPYVRQIMDIALDSMSLSHGDTVREMAPK